MDRTRFMRRPGGRRVLAMPLLLAVAIPLVACTRGEGPAIAETRDVGPFSRVEVGSGITLQVRVGPVTSLEVRAQDAILPEIATEVSTGTLHIEANGDYVTTEPVTVSLATPTLTAVEAGGGAEVRIDAIDAATLDLVLKGGSRIAATGTITDLSILLDGGSQAELGDLATQRITVTSGGAATGVLRATESISGTASGGSVLTVSGGARLGVETSGAATVTNAAP